MARRHSGEYKKPYMVVLFVVENDFLDEYLKCLDEANIAVECIIYCHQNIEKINFVSTAAILLPVKNDYALFVDNLEKYSTAFPLFTFLHPLFLAPFVSLDYGRKRANVLSFSASGIAILFEILRYIESNHLQNFSSSIGAKEQMFVFFSQHYKAAAEKMVKQAFGALEITAISNIAVHGLRLDFDIYFKEQQFYITSLADFYNFCDSIVGVKDLTEPNAFDFYASKGFVNITIVRNLLDILVSMVIPHGNEVTQKNMTSDDIRLETIKALSDLDMFSKNAELVLEMYGIIADNMSLTNIIRLEDLRSNPIATLKKLYEWLDVTIDDSALQTLWSVIGDKKLYAGGGLSLGMSPGTNRWRCFLTLEHLKILKKLGYENMMRRLGYDDEFYIDRKIDDYEFCSKVEACSASNRVEFDINVTQTKMICFDKKYLDIFLDSYENNKLFKIIFNSVRYE